MKHLRNRLDPAKKPHGAYPLFGKPADIEHWKKNQAKGDLRLMNPSLEDVKEVVASVWEEILGVSGVHLDEGFMELGGTSIAAEQIASRIRRVFAVSVQGSDILRSNTLSCFAEVVVRRLITMNPESSQPR